jgi:uncharacterized membrane protein YcaP (DUF421 family)
MWDWVFGSWRTVGYVAVNTVLVYVSVLVAIRVGERRTLAQMSTFDLIVAVSLGAIIGRTATAPSPSYAQGLAAVVTLLAAHAALSWGRRHLPHIVGITERNALLIVSDGVVLPGALERAHLTSDDLACVLREHGVAAIDQVAAVVLEARGAFSVVRADAGPLGREVLTGVEGVEQRSSR